MISSIQPGQAEELIARFRRDPLFFCEKALGISPWRKQAEVLSALRDYPRVAVRSGHGTGKSFIAAAAALWFLYSHHPAKVITTAPTWNQVRAILWQEIRSQHAKALIPLGGEVLEERIKLGPNSFAVGLSTDESERFQGYHSESILVILDEAPGVRPDIWEAAETLLTSRCSRLLAIGNPVRSGGRFHECFAPGSGWQTIHISCLDSPNFDGASGYPALVTRAWVEDKRLRWGEKSPLFQSRVLGEFPEEGDGALIPRRALEESAKRPAGEVEPAEYRLGVDVARSGSDETVLLLRDQRAIRSIEAHSGWSTMQTAGRVVRLMREHGIPPERVFVDDTGLGAGVVDRLREQDYPVRAVVLGGRGSDSEHFANCRAECFWRLRDCILEGNAASGFSLGNDQELLHELAETRYTLTSSGAIRIELKENLRARLGGSPDRADALALTFAEGVPFSPEISVL